MELLSAQLETRKAAPRNLARSIPGLNARNAIDVTGFQPPTRDQIRESEACYQAIELAKRSRSLGMLVLTLRGDGVGWSEVYRQLQAAWDEESRCQQESKRTLRAKASGLSGK